MKKIIAIFTVFFIVGIGFSMSKKPLTRAEKTEFKETSTYRDVIDFIFQIREASDRVKVKFIGKSTEGRKIPLVIVSKEGISTPLEARDYGKEVIYIQANIHAGEVEGKEASLMMIRELAFGSFDKLLENQVVLFCPIFNPDGNEKFGKHRYSDNGPELAGVRYNGQGLDLNRDFIKQETPEVRAFIRIIKEWDPILFVDMHTTNGSFHQHIITWTPQMAPWTDKNLTEYSWGKMFKKINEYMKEMGYNPIPHGGFKNRKKPSDGWLFWAVLGRYSTNYYGLRNRFAILDENYARADFKSRVSGAFTFLRVILKFTNNYSKEMREIAKRADLKASKEFYREKFPYAFSSKYLFNFKLKSYKFNVKKIPKKEIKNYPAWFGGYLVEKTEESKVYDMEYYAPIKPVEFVSLPEAYIILPSAKKVVPLLIRNGIVVEKLLEEKELYVEIFKIDKIEASKLPYQGHHTKKVSGKYVKMKIKVPEGAYVVSLRQPLSRLITVMLEPLSPDGFLYWGLFDEVLVHEWSRKPWMIPVLRAMGIKGLKLELTN